MLSWSPVILISMALASLVGAALILLELCTTRLERSPNGGDSLFRYKPAGVFKVIHCGKVNFSSRGEPWLVHPRSVLAARRLVRLLGVEVGWRPSFKVPGEWLYLDGRAVINTWLKSQERGLGGVDHIAFGSCGDPDAKRAELQRLGFAFTEAGLVDTEITQFFVNRPKGMKIELQCPRKDA
jgi:hypothetical protein